MAGQQSTLDQARQTLTDAASHLPVGVIVSTTDGTTAVADSTTLVQTYKSDQQLCAAVSNSSTYVLPDGLTCADIPARLSSATEVQTAARALVTAENQLASSQAQTKQTGDNAQAAVTDAITAQAATLLKDQQAIVTAERQLETAQTSYQSTLASNAAAASPATASDIAQQQASVVTAQVAVATAQKAVSDTVLVAPASGTVSAVNGAVGEAVASGGDGLHHTRQPGHAAGEGCLLRDGRSEGAGRPDGDRLVRRPHRPDVHRQGRRDRRRVDSHEQRRDLQRDRRTRLDLAPGEGGHDGVGRRHGGAEGRRARVAGLRAQRTR